MIVYFKIKAYKSFSTLYEMNKHTRVGGCLMDFMLCV